MPRCVCGCGRRGRHRHHVVYQQEIRRHHGAGGRIGAETRHEYQRALGDPRNLVWVDFDCHLAHHGASRRLPLRVLPDSAFEFAVELLGASPAYCYLRRYYAGEDPRLDALLEAT